MTDVPSQTGFHLARCCCSLSACGCRLGGKLQLRGRVRLWGGWLPVAAATPAVETSVRSTAPRAAWGWAPWPGSGPHRWTRPGTATPAAASSHEWNCRSLDHSPETQRDKESGLTAGSKSSVQTTRGLGPVWDGNGWARCFPRVAGARHVKTQLHKLSPSCCFCWPESPKDLDTPALVRFESGHCETSRVQNVHVWSPLAVLLSTFFFWSLSPLPLPWTSFTRLTSSDPVIYVQNQFSYSV